MLSVFGTFKLIASGVVEAISDILGPIVFFKAELRMLGRKGSTALTIRLTMKSGILLYSKEI